MKIHTIITDKNLFSDYIIDIKAKFQIFRTSIFSYLFFFLPISQRTEIKSYFSSVQGILEYIKKISESNGIWYHWSIMGICHTDMIRAQCPPLSYLQRIAPRVQMLTNSGSHTHVQFLSIIYHLSIYQYNYMHMYIYILYVILIFVYFFM